VQNLRALRGRFACNLFITAYKFPYSRWKYTSTFPTLPQNCKTTRGPCGPLVSFSDSFPVLFSDSLSESVFQDYGMGTAAMVEGELVLPEASTLSTM